MALSAKPAIVLQIIQRSTQALSHLLWPGACALCGEHIEADDHGLCRKCWQELLSVSGGDYCGFCGAPGSRYMLGQRRCEHCRDHELHLDGIARAGIYSGALARLIVAFKHDRTDLSHYINLLALPAFTASAFYQEIEVLVPVPLHWRRNFSRGYNQAHLIARSLQHPTARISLDLARMRNTKMQSSLAFEKRSANIRGAFAVRRGHSFSGKTICLVDDIKTTGATINECARVLKEAGAKKVYAVVIAVAERSS